MEQLISTLEHSTRSIGERLDQLDERVAVLRGQWTGEASDAYDSAQRISRQQLAEMNSILRGSGAAADAVRARHLAAATAVERLWG